MTTASRTQAWDPDALGNFDSVTSDSSTQTRGHNKQNEVTSVSGATTPAYDANGNTTTDETGKQYVYDAWNRLVVVKNSGGTTLVTHAYDGLNRRVSETISSTTRDFYHSAEWQVLEERVSGTARVQYVWSPVYVDALVLRDRDSDSNGSLEERLYVQQDANWNVTALVDTSGAVVERFVYDPYGVVTILTGSWGSRSSSLYGWVHLHQGGRLETTSGLYEFRMRWYSPTLMRWMQRDPIHIGAGDPNFYRALGNNPANALDPSGLFSVYDGFLLGQKAAQTSIRIDQTQYFVRNAANGFEGVKLYYQTMAEIERGAYADLLDYMLGPGTAARAERETGIRLRDPELAAAAKTGLKATANAMIDTVTSFVSFGFWNPSPIAVTDADIARGYRQAYSCSRVGSEILSGVGVANLSAVAGAVGNVALGWDMGGNGVNVTVGLATGDPGRVVFGLGGLTGNLSALRTPTNAPKPSPGSLPKPGSLEEAIEMRDTFKQMLDQAARRQDADVWGFALDGWTHWSQQVRRLGGG